MNVEIFECREKINHLIRAVAIQRGARSNSIDWFGEICGFSPSTLKSQMAKGALSIKVINALAATLPDVPFTTHHTWRDEYGTREGKVRFGRDSAVAFRQYLGEQLGQLAPVRFGLETTSHELSEPDLVKFELEGPRQGFSMGETIPALLTATFGQGRLGEITSFRLRKVRIEIFPDTGMGVSSPLGRATDVIELRDARLDHTGGPRTSAWTLYGTPAGLQGEYATREAPPFELKGTEPGRAIMARLSIQTAERNAITIVSGEDLNSTVNAIFKGLATVSIPPGIDGGWRVLGVQKLRVVPQ
jgi:hypothetical protein